MVQKSIRFTLLDRQRIQEHVDKHGYKGYCTLARSMNRNHKSIMHELRTWRSRHGEDPYNAAIAHEECGKLKSDDKSEAKRYKLNSIYKNFQDLIPQIPETEENARAIDLILNNLCCLGANRNLRKTVKVSMEEKEKIYHYIKLGYKPHKIAILLNKSRSAIYRWVGILEKENIEKLKRDEIEYFLSKNHE
jgi:IS30 family transposase